MNDARFQTPGHPARPRGGFTLTEVLIVIALMLLVITLAIPAFSVITGGRSVDAAQNQISAALARARQDAMGLQEPRGILFFPDADTGRVALAEVYFKNYQRREWFLELLPEREELQLPIGVGCQVLPRGDGSGATPLPTMGLILFDGLGRLSIHPYWIPPNVVTDPNDPNYNALRVRIGPDPLPADYPPLGTNLVPLTSQIGLLLFDQAGYDDAADKATFLNDNATPVLVNRYNGTLVQSP